MSTNAGQKIRILIVDDNVDTQDNLKKMLYFERDMEIVGVAGGGHEGIQRTKELHPDIIMMDVNMPDLDGMRAAEILRAEVPGASIIMISVQGEQEYLRRAMVAGASDYLIKPFSTDDLVNSIRLVYQREGLRQRLNPLPPVPTGVQAAQPQALAQSEPGRIIAIYSPKGGVGRTTIAINLSVALKATTKKSVALLDCSLLFGDVGVMLNLVTKKSIADLIPHIGELDAELIGEVMFTHSSGIRVLLAPPRPEMAELVTADAINVILGKLRTMFDYVVVDTNPSFQDAVLAILDNADRIITVSTPEVSSLKNMKLLWETTEALGYPQAKLMLVINRAHSAGGIPVDEIEANVNQKVASVIVNDWKLATFAVNNGVPFILSNRESQISKDIFALANMVLEKEGVKAGESLTRGRGIGGRFGLFKKSS